MELWGGDFLGRRERRQSGRGKEDTYHMSVWHTKSHYLQQRLGKQALKVLIGFSSNCSQKKVKRTFSKDVWDIRDLQR